MPRYDIKFIVRHRVDSLVDADIALVQMEDAAPKGAFLETILTKVDRFGNEVYQLPTNKPTIDQIFKEAQENAKD